MNSATRTTALIVVLTLISGIPAEAQIGNFFRSLFGYSIITNEQPTPVFTIPLKDPGQRYVQFLAMGDMGTGESDQLKVSKAMAEFAAHEPISFVLTTGDNIYEDGVTSVTDSQWSTKFEKPYDYPTLQIPFYAVLGNHDTRGNIQAQVEYTSVSKKWKMPALNYTFQKTINDTASIEFFCLDTNPLAYLKKEKLQKLSETGKEQRLLHWLDSSISVSTARWKIVVGHHTIYSAGEHGNNQALIALIEPILIKNHVDMYICGHDHHLEMLKPVNGVHYLVTGGGGKHYDVTWNANTEFAHTNCGYNFIRIGVHEMLIEFFDRDGDLIYCSTIFKNQK